MATPRRKATTKRGSTAKKPVKSRASKKQKKTDWKWRLISILLIITMLIFLLQYLTPQQVNWAKDAVTSTINKSTAATTPTKKAFIPPKYHALEIPVYKPTTQSSIIAHTAYTLSYSLENKNPNWVAYELIKDELKGNEKRYNRFIKDPKLTGESASNNSYKKSGYDKGHMAPAGDMKWDKEVMKESFHLTNISPQTPSLNRGAWKTLEEEIRKWTYRDSALVVICGPIYSNPTAELKDGVKIPSSFYKIIAAPYIENPRAIAFIMPNTQSVDNDITKYVVSVDSVERLLNMDVLSKLPDTIENQIEKTSNYAQWR